MKWADSLSQELFERRLNNEEIETDNQSAYFPRTLPPYEKPVRFIDCGGYNGDTIKELSLIEKEIEYVISFEPHNLFVEELKKNVANMPFRVIVYNKGVYYENMQRVPFYFDNGDASRITDENDSYIETVKLDDIIFDLKPNFIKMDIEGAEYRALIGARETIRKYKPRLAICLYHHPNDFIDIPLLVDSWDLGYQLYFRTPYKSNFRLFAIHES